jgi:hypothetical protein
MDFPQVNQVAKELAREIVELVPHWYEAPFGPRRFSVTVGNFVIEFCNHFELSAKLSEFLQAIGHMVRELPLHRFDQYPGLVDVLRESIAIEWLRSHAAEIDWGAFAQIPERPQPADEREFSCLAERANHSGQRRN